MIKSVIKKQRALARSLVYELTGKQIRHLKTGRPFVDQSTDISISHKNDLVGVGMVSDPYRVGIDIEYINTKLNTKLFMGSVITDKETIFLKKFCKDNKLPLSSGIAIFWSIKESFFKCLDYDLKPKKIGILGISGEGTIRFGISDEIKMVMKSRRMKIFFSDTYFIGDYVFARTVMKKA